MNMKYNTISKEDLLYLLNKKLEYIGNYDIICLMKETKKDLNLNKYPLPPEPPSPRIIKEHSKFEMFMVTKCLPILFTVSILIILYLKL